MGDVIPTLDQQMSHLLYNMVRELVTFRKLLDGSFLSSCKYYQWMRDGWSHRSSTLEIFYFQNIFQDFKKKHYRGTEGVPRNGIILAITRDGHFVFMSWG